MFLRRVFVLLGAIALPTACSVAPAAQDVGPGGTALVGGLPPTSQSVDSSDGGGSNGVVRTTVPLPVAERVGSLISGNRVILIGDSVMASTASRYGNNMCETLVPLGWQVEVDAETSRFIDFGKKVLDERLSAGWDVGVILLGNNYGGDQETFRRGLERMVQRLSPAPVVLLTVTEFTPSRAQVNDVIFDLAGAYDNVLIVDWGVTTDADPTLTGSDGLHLTDQGRASLAEQVSLALGTAATPNGKCLSTTFRDDSGGSVHGNTTTTEAGNTPTTSKGTSTTVRGTTTTAVPASATSSTDAPATTSGTPTP